MPTIIDVTGLQNALIGTTDISDIGDGTITSGLDKHNENFATEETSPTTAAHAIGEYIIWKGTLYRVKTAISTGATLEVGRNIIKRTTVGVTEDLAGSIATIETSPATANHSVGEYIVYNGQLYKVTTAITAGDTLAGKISAVSIGDRHSVKYITSQVTAGANVNIRQVSVAENFSTVTLSIQFDVTGTAKANGETILSGIPSEYRPIYFVYVVAQGNPTDAPVSLSATGTITAGGRGVPVGSWYSASFTFPK